MYKKLILSILCVFFVSSCSVYTLVDSNKVTEFRGLTLSVDTPWTRVGESYFGSHVAMVWTIDGGALNQLFTFSQVSDGETLFKKPGEELVMPVYKKDMLPNEISELLVSSLKNHYGGKLSIKTSDLRPQAFGNEKGFSFGIDFFNLDGLFIKGKVFSTIVNDQLYLMLFMAPDLYYYEKNIANVESIVASAIIKP